MYNTNITIEDLLSTYYYADGTGKRGACLEVYARVKAAFDLLDEARKHDDPDATYDAINILQYGE